MLSRADATALKQSTFENLFNCHILISVKRFITSSFQPDPISCTPTLEIFSLGYIYRHTTNINI